MEIAFGMEKGKREYGVGTTRQLYIIIDRTPAESKNSYFVSSSPATNLPIMKSVFSAVQVSEFFALLVTLSSSVIFPISNFIYLYQNFV